MTTMLRQVLHAFEDTQQPRTLSQLARELEMPPGMLEGMIAYWVRKGKLRESGNEAGCSSCQHGHSCPYITQMPRTFELVTDDDPIPPAPPSCGCCG